MIMSTKRAASPGEFLISRIDDESPWVLWGGTLPSGSLKYLTFKQYLAQQPASSLTSARGLIEVSDGCSALALDSLGQEMGLNTAAACSESGARYLRSQGFRGELLPSQSLEEAFLFCEQKSERGWIWPGQMTNRELIGCVESWTGELANHLTHRRLRILEIVTGFGTGATAVGLVQTFTPRGARVMAVESRPGQKIQGWRHFASQNLGPVDLFYPFADMVERNECLALARDSLGGLILSRSHVSPEQRLIVSHNLIPPRSV